MDWMPQAIRDGIFTVLFISGPLVLLAAALGLVIGIIQAATQVQEQTLGSAVKILGVFLALIVFGFYMCQYLKQYTSQTISRAFNMVPGLSSHPLPPKKLFKQPIKEETDHPLFSPEDLAETAPVEPSGGAGKTSEGDSIPEDAEVVEVPPEPVVDKLPEINYLTRPLSGLREAVIEQLAPENGEEAVEEEASADPQASARPSQAPAARPAQQTTPRPAAQAPARQAQQPVRQPTQQAARPVAAPAQQPARQTTTTQAQQAPARQQQAQATRPAATRPAPARPAVRPAARPAAPVVEEEVAAPIVNTQAPRNTELESSRSRARAALNRIKSSIDEVKTEGAATAE